MEPPPLLEAKAEELERAGRKPYLLAPFAVDPAGAGRGRLRRSPRSSSTRQSTEAGIDPDWLYLLRRQHDAGRHGWWGCWCARPAHAAGSTSRRSCWSEPARADIARIANAAARAPRSRRADRAAEIESHDEYIGVRYGVPSEGGREAMTLLAPHRGGDPRSGLQQQGDGRPDRSHPQGADRPGRDVVFLHTGGTPALFAYAADLGLG